MGGVRLENVPSGFSFTMGDIGQFQAMGILCGGNDGWFVDDLNMNITINGVKQSINWPYNQWIDGNGQHQQTENATGSYTDAPNYEIFFPDGSWASQMGVTMGEVSISCPSEYAACLQSACSTEVGPLITAASSLDALTTLQAPNTASAETTALVQCITQTIAASSTAPTPDPNSQDCSSGGGR